ncbi:MAG: SDR family oxidoreductase [Pyrinomonadaceae bacterium]
MSILIIGGSGMLGHKLYQRLSTEFEVFATIRTNAAAVERFGIFNSHAIFPAVDVTDINSIRRVLEVVRPECVVNCVGVVKQNPTLADKIRTLTINSIFPNQLAQLSAEFGFRPITISTDCVFDGKTGNYSESDEPNARDLYGMSKLLGEVTEGRSLTIRTSIIGREISTSHSIVEWFLTHRGGSVDGYTKAIYSGFPTIELADTIANLIKNFPDLNGLFHISSEPISKFDLLTLANKYFNANITINPSEAVVVDRSLDSARFKALTGFASPDWEAMIARMAADPMPYDSFR